MPSNLHFLLGFTYPTTCVLVEQASAKAVPTFKKSPGGNTFCTLHYASTCIDLSFGLPLQVACELPSPSSLSFETPFTRIPCDGTTDTNQGKNSQHKRMEKHPDPTPTWVEQGKLLPSSFTKILAHCSLDIPVASSSSVIKPPEPCPIFLNTSRLHR